MDDLYSVMQSILQREKKINALSLTVTPSKQAHFWVVGLDKATRILFIESILQDQTEGQSLEPVEVFSLALQKQATQIILCRNSLHIPANFPPSENEKDIVNHLLQIGLLVNAPILDYQIIFSNQGVSFKQLGIMDELQFSNKYVPSYELTKRIQDEANALLQQKNSEAKAKIELIQKELEYTQQKAKKDKLNIATGLKKEGIDWAIIARVTGLSIETIKAL